LNSPDFKKKNNMLYPTRISLAAAQQPARTQTRVLHIAEKNSVRKALSRVFATQLETNARRRNVNGVEVDTIIEPARGEFLNQGKASNNSRNKMNFNGLFEPNSTEQTSVPLTHTICAVRGHLYHTDFQDEQIRTDWIRTNPESLFDEKIKASVPPENTDLAKMLRTLAVESDAVVLWLDCDREGEGIAFEVLDTIENARRSETIPPLTIRRATFSALTPKDIITATNNFNPTKNKAAIPNKNLANAVNARIEIDLRSGAAFTRFLSLRYQKLFPNLKDNVISYGACQFPTLGFIAKRRMQRERFEKGRLWSVQMGVELGKLAEFAKSIISENSKNSEDGLKMVENIDKYTNHTLKSRKTIAFTWKKPDHFPNHEKREVQKVFDYCNDKENAKASLTVLKKSMKKERPLPLTTVELCKNMSNYAKFSAKKTLELAEKLYHNGYISYPRTETNVFDLKKGYDLKKIAKPFADPANSDFTEYTEDSFKNNFVLPSSGSKDDNAHPPIHPVKVLRKRQCNDDDVWTVYEFIVRRFLACISPDAIGERTRAVIGFQNNSDENFGNKAASTYGPQSFTIGGTILKEANLTRFFYNPTQKKHFLAHVKGFFEFF